jgi:thiosulfate/3-mercaptopyruvate sulfurtransferase
VQTTSPDTLRTELPPLDSLQRLLVRAGVNDQSRVLIVGQPIPAARMAFTVAVLGLDGRAAVLDGGVDAWREAGRTISREVSAPVSGGTLTITPTLRWLARADDVRGAVRGDGTTLLDARLPEFYFGYSSNGFPRAGHVAGAGNVPFSTVTRELGRLRSPAELDRLLAAAGARAGASVVTYCHVGQQASLLWLAARVAGRSARMYDGSFQEWSRLGDAPIATLDRR